MYCLHLIINPQDGSSMFLQNVCTYTQNYRELHPRRQNLNAQCFPVKKLFRVPVKKKTINEKTYYKGNVK
jgi:hypothetical protein